MMHTGDGDVGWRSRQNDVAFFADGSLIWLEVDALIRRQTGGKRSLDDFARAFYGPPGGTPAVKTYTADDVYRALSEVSHYDWGGFFRSRLDAVGEPAPLAGLSAAGWELSFSTEPNAYDSTLEHVSLAQDEMYSIGLKADASGTVLDIQDGLAAARAGLVPGMHIVKVDGKPWARGVLRATIADAKLKGTMLTLQATLFDRTETYVLDYRDGLRYPHLVRNDKGVDVLAQISAPTISLRDSGATAPGSAAVTP